MKTHAFPLPSLFLAATCLGTLPAAASAQGQAGPPEILVNNVAGDDTAALQTALNQAGNGPAIVRFQAGTYDFYPPYPIPGNGWVHLDDASDIEIAGHGAVLVLHDFDPNKAPGANGAYPSYFFGFQNVAGLEIHDLSVQMTREPYSSGIVTGKSVGAPYWIDITLEQGYPDLASGFQIQRIDDFDPVTDRLKGLKFSVLLNPGEYQTTVTPGAGNPVVRLTSNLTDPTAWFNDRLISVPTGTGLVLMHSKYRCHFLVARSCSALEVTHVTLQDMPGMGVLAYNTEDVTLTDFDIEPAAGRLLSITADAVHLMDCTGAVLMQDCELRRMGDDGFNSHGKFLKFTKAISVVGGPTIAYFDQVVDQPYYNLDWSTAAQELEFVSPSLARRGSSQMTNFHEVDPPTFGQYSASFANGLPPGTKKNDLVANPDKLPASVLIQNCTVEDNLARGVTLHGRHITVSGCTFRRNVGPAVMLEAELISFYETSPGLDLEVTGCLIEDSNRFTWAYVGAITVLGEYLDSVTQARTIAAAGLHRDIRITGNTFTGLRDENPSPRRRVAIWTSSSDDVELESNTFTDIGVLHAQGGRTVGIARVENATAVVSDGLNCVEASYVETVARPAFTLINTAFAPVLFPTTCGLGW
jgi:hypothetical protein